MKTSPETVATIPPSLDAAWAPVACTLPTAERPLRVAEFDDLFDASLEEVEHVDRTRARLHLSGPPGLRAQVQDLADREASCCSFFTFTLHPRTGTGQSTPGLTLEVGVPTAHRDVLSGLVTRARTALTERVRGTTDVPR